MKLQYKKKPAKRVTIKDLADDLGLSVGAVSQALNPRDNINIKLKPETIARVRAHARTMNYRPHAGASSIRSKHFCNIGYMPANPDLDPIEPSEAEQGVHDAALDHNFRVTLLRTPSVEAKNREAVSRVFNESHLDALIMLNYSRMPANYEPVFTETDFPVVHLNHKQDFQAVYSDDVTGGRVLTEHLLNEGYKNIAFFQTTDPSTEENPHYSSIDRLIGYQQAMKKAGASAQQAWYLSNKGEAATRTWLEGKNRPDAVFCKSDEDAAEFFRIAYAARLRVPDDIAVCGFNGSPASRFSWVPLTTMEIPYYQIAYTAFKKTIEQINMSNPEPFASLTIEPTLQVRESTRKTTDSVTIRSAEAVPVTV